MNIQPYLPSRKIQIGLLILLVLGLAYLVYYFVQQGSDTEPEKNFIDVAPVTETDKKNKEYYKDTDNDGAYDWEEALWPELDPNNPDSDGDGVLDGRYIRAKRAIQERERVGATLPESNLSETEKLGRSAYTALLAIAESGGELDEQTQEQFSENIAQYINDLSLGDKLYTRDQFELVEDTKENIYAYRTTMKKLLERYPVATKDIELILQAAKDPQSYQTELYDASLKYGEYLNELVAIPVPYTIAGRHTELTNNISQISGALNNFLEEEIDELVSLAFLVQIQKIMNETAESIIKINTYFDIVDDPKIFE